MKATIEFNLPEEEEQFNAANKGMDWALLAWDVDQLLRDKLKYGKLLPNTRAELEEIRDTLNEMLVDRGLTYPSQKYIMYRPLPDYVTIRESSITGLGLFATKKILAGTYIGIVHIINENDSDGITRTPLGGFGNHSDNPNCFKIILGQTKTWIGALRDIEPDEEITWKYTLYEIK